MIVNPRKKKLSLHLEFLFQKFEAFFIYFLFVYEFIYLLNNFRINKTNLID